MTTTITNDKDSDINVAVQAAAVVEHTLEVCLSALKDQVQDLASKRATAETQISFLTQLQKELEAGIENVTDQINCLKGQLKKVRTNAGLPPPRSYT